MRTRNARHGYTLVELMVVVAIVSMAIVATAPGFSRALSDKRAGDAMRALVRLGNQARTEAISTGTAFLLWIQPADRGGTAALIRGTNNSCRNQDWNGRYASMACGAHRAPCMLEIDLSSSEYSSVFSTEVMFESTDGGAVAPTATALCYKRDGTVWHDQPATLAALNLVDTNADMAARGGYRFVVRMIDDSGAVRGVVRRMFFPLGAAPRVVR